MSDSAARADDWQPWQMATLERRSRPSERPAGEAEGAPARRREDAISYQMFELAKEEAVEKGYAAGHKKGYAAGYEEGEAKVRAEHAQNMADQIQAALEPIEALAAEFRRSIEQINGEVSHELVQLALEAGEQLAGRSLQLKPEHILDDIEQLVADTPRISGTPTLYVSSGDHALVESQLAAHLEASGWALRAEPELERGDCRVVTDQSAVASIGSDRWARLLHSVGHGEH